MLRQDSRHALHAAEHGAMNHNGSLKGLVSSAPGCLVLQMEPNGQLEIQLHGSALVHSVHRVEHLNVDFGAIECAVSRVDLPVTRPYIYREREGERENEKEQLDDEKMN